MNRLATRLWRTVTKNRAATRTAMVLAPLVLLALVAIVHLVTARRYSLEMEGNGMQLRLAPAAATTPTRPPFLP
jgi:hypothetical protein